MVAMLVLVIYIAIALPLGFLTLSLGNTDASCEGGLPFPPLSETDIDECKRQGAQDRMFGAGLLALCLPASLGILLIAAARRSRGPERTIACPHCNLEVSVGVPTCLRCGYNLAARHQQ